MPTHPMFLIVVFDSLRPDMVTPELAPNLFQFMADGCSFPHSRAVFPASTYPNAAALATGSTPRHNGIVSNRYFDPSVFRDGLFQPALGSHISAGQAAYDGNLYCTPSLGELAAAAGYSTATISNGSPGMCLPMNPRANQQGHINLCFKEWEASPLPSAANALLKEFGPIPPSAQPNIAQNRLLTDILLEAVYPRYQPDLTLVWFTDPDQTYHYTGLGSPETETAIQHVDAQFGRMIDWWRASKFRTRLQVIAVSDHGHLTTRERINVNQEAGRVGLVIGDHFQDGADYAGYTSYSGGVRVRDGEPKLRAALVEWLADQPWCGVIFTGGGNGVEGGVPGTFDYSLVLMDHERAPHVGYVMRNFDSVHGNGLVGSCFFNGAYPEGGGTHGGLHPKELHNVMAAQGSLFREGFRSEYPAGIIDIAPTILHLLELPQPNRMDGRVLREALAGDNGEPPAPERFTRSVERHGRAQYLRYSSVGTTTYLDAGWSE
ncbi:MAG: alkaline phosphatase family protein [SAR324 cluster bacterium]|nr:alkaline phosphatase family protein [SAR324 cluster bacterium]